MTAIHSARVSAAESMLQRAAFGVEQAVADMIAADEPCEGAVSGQWTASDPWHGDLPRFVRQLRRASRDDARRRCADGCGLATASAGWLSGQGERAVVSVATDVRAIWAVSLRQVDAVAGALQRYANDVDAVKQQQSAIIACQEETSQTLLRARRSVDRLASDSSADLHELSVCERK
ncbi:MAG: hypothetical protein R2723_01940 [Microbacterium sp.]